MSDLEHPTAASRLRAIMLRGVRAFPSLDSRLRRLRRRWLARGSGYPDWSALTSGSEAWRHALASAGTGKKVLVATSIGAHLPAMQMESVLAAALSLRGAKVEVLLCDAVLPACQMCEPRYFADPSELARDGPQKSLCYDCYAPGRSVYQTLGVTVHRYSEFLTEDERAEADRLSQSMSVEQMAAFDLDGLKIGEHAKAGALRFYASATIDHEPDADAIVRRYFKAALLTSYAADRLMKQHGYDVAVFHHGIYVPQGLIGEVARRNGVRVVNWNPAYRRNCFLFSHDDTYHHTLMNEPISTWADMAWPQSRSDGIRKYLRSRWEGTNDWIRFHGDPVFESEAIRREIGCDKDRPIIACLTNVMWDAQLHYPANAFANMLDWLVHTVNYFAGRPDLQLVIRVHPAEVTGTVPTRQPVANALLHHFGALPENVFLIPPTSDISTYVLAEMSDSVIIYGTKTGVELAAVGIPVIVAGEAWIRGKGLTQDATSPASYEKLLAALPTHRRMPPDQVDRALRYAHHFFFRRMIPVTSFAQGPGWPPFMFAGSSIAALTPGTDPGLDCICDGILDGAPFVFDGPPNE
jgi:hypothetical protein